MELAFFIITPIVTFFLGALAIFVGLTRKIGELQVEHSKALAKAKHNEYRAGYNTGIDVGKELYAVSKAIHIQNTVRNRIIRRLRQLFYKLDGLASSLSK